MKTLTINKTLKIKLLLFAILFFFIEFINAQTRVPNDDKSPIWYNNDNVGIGTSNPRSKLTIQNGFVESFLPNLPGEGSALAGFSLSSVNTTWKLYIAAPDGGFGVGPQNFELWEYPNNIAGGNCCRRRFVIENSYGKTGGGLFYMNSDGNVGIGTPTPQNALDVNGTIRAKEVKVETGWADFVFAPTYKLRPLSEVEQFIKTNGHLPEIPKAEEVQQNGVNLGEMQTKLLQKVEELTLYVIEQQKLLKQATEKIATLENENKRLNEKIK